jgi:hypothetical protein
MEPFYASSNNTYKILCGPVSNNIVENTAGQHPSQDEEAARQVASASVGLTSRPIGRL